MRLHGSTHLSKYGTDAVQTPRRALLLCVTALLCSQLATLPPLAAKQFDHAPAAPSSSPPVVNPHSVAPLADSATPWPLFEQWAAGGLLSAAVFGQPVTQIRLLDAAALVVVLFPIGAWWWHRRRRHTTATIIDVATLFADPAAPTSTPATASDPADCADADVPMWFDNAAFIETVKLLFIRVQEAWDRGDIRDLHTITTPAGLAALQQERAHVGMGTGTAPHFTEVLTLTADVCDVRHEQDAVIVQVRFCGWRQHTATGIKTPFAELWQVQHHWAEQYGDWLITHMRTEPPPLPPLIPL